MSLTIITGCMFSGKTTTLLRKALSVPAINRLIIKPSIDTRSLVDGVSTGISTHEGFNIPAFAINHVDEIDSYLQPLPYRSHSTITHIFIDEAQFLVGLKEKVINLISQYHVILAGLDYTYRKEEFGDLLKLQPYANEWIQIRAVCAYDVEGEDTVGEKHLPALYTHRLAKDSRLILIGGKESYIPVCGECYDKINTL